MPKLIIDNREIEVPEGTKVIEAAERLGIMIPRFCYHEALGSVGACRLCAVKFLQGPFKGVQMSCMIDAQDGMVVSTTDEEAVAFRRQVIEWLMLNHPHDCPVCDEGGQCLLQDETMSSGHSIRRYAGQKRTYINQYLGPFIDHEMNRCIHCYRCSRFYQEFSGYRDLGPMQIRDRVYFGRFKDGTLESPFAGNLVDICPTGVYTDKTARFKVRRWDLERSSSVCIHCSLGCNTVANARYREVLRVEARFSEAVNGYFICDRGRFGYGYASHLERPRSARLGTGEVSIDRAMQTAAERLQKIRSTAGPQAIAALGSWRSSLETQGALKRLGQSQGWGAVHYFADPVQERNVRAAVSLLDERTAVSMREIEDADFIVVVGVDPVNEAPMLAMAMRQAFRHHRAPVVVIDPRPVSLPMDFEHIPAAPKDLDRYLDALMQPVGEMQKGSGGRIADGDRLNAVALGLQTGRKPVIVCGTEIVKESTVHRAARCAEGLRDDGRQAGLFYVLPGANAFGAGLLTAQEQPSFLDTLEAIEQGQVKALIVVEHDPLLHFPDRARLEQALDKLELLLVLDYVPSQTAKRAHILLPSATLYETDSTFINQEGRAQFARHAHWGGTPVGQVSGGTHPPRVYSNEIPGRVFKPAWRLLQELSRLCGAVGQEVLDVNPWPLLAQNRPDLADLKTMSYPVDGVRVLPQTADELLPPSPEDAGDKERAQDDLELLVVEATFGTEELSGYADVIHKVEEEPYLLMHAADAARGGFTQGDRVVVSLGKGSLEVELRVSERMAPGTLILPKHRRVAWQHLERFPAWTPLADIRKI